MCVCVCCKTATWQGYRMSMYTAFDDAYLIGVTTNDLRQVGKRNLTIIHNTDLQVHFMDTNSFRLRYFSLR